MNNRFFIHEITIYHCSEEDDDNYQIFHFNQVYFRHTRKVNVIDKGIENASSGTIYIPTTDDITSKIGIDDLVVEGNLSEEYKKVYSNTKIKKYRIISIDDNRKGNLQHYKLGVSD